MLEAASTREHRFTLSLRLVVAITNYGRGENPGSTITTGKRSSMTPSRALMVIGELHNLEFTETKEGARVLTLESRKEAERIFEEMV